MRQSVTLRTLCVLCVLFTAAPHASAGQEITWTDISASVGLPEGVRLHSGVRTSPALRVWYYEVDLTRDDVALVPYMARNNSETITSFSARHKVIGAVNGGYFGGGSSYSSLVRPGQVLAQNVAAVTRSSKSYPVTRGFFSLDEQNRMSIDWIYHFSSEPEGVYRFQAPLPNGPEGSAQPLPAPTPDQGTPMSELFMGVGGGPVLVKGDSIHITYNEEIFWGSGVGRDNRDPRTAVGFTDDGRAILLVADGRQANSQGLSLPEMAQLMIDLGCVEAMNLDGGGSSMMSVGSTLVNRPQGSTSQRPVATFLAITVPDSVPARPAVDFESIFDTEFDGVQKTGSWSETANPGFYGGSKSLITQVGATEATLSYPVSLPGVGEFELHGWWAASSNRSSRTAYIVHHRDGIDTVRADQTTNNASWVSLGTFPFTGTASDKVVISTTGSTAGTYVVADAIRFTGTYLPTSTEFTDGFVASASPNLIYAYPNPFNPELSISFRMMNAGTARLEVYDLGGRLIETLIPGSALPKGMHTARWDASGRASGTFLVRLEMQQGGSLQTHTKHITLLK